MCLTHNLSLLLTFYFKSWEKTWIRSFHELPENNSFHSNQFNWSKYLIRIKITYTLPLSFDVAFLGFTSFESGWILSLYRLWAITDKIRVKNINLFLLLDFFELFHWCPLMKNDPPWILNIFHTRFSLSRTYHCCFAWFVIVFWSMTNLE